MPMVTFGSWGEAHPLLTPIEDSIVFMEHGLAKCIDTMKIGFAHVKRA